MTYKVEQHEHIFEEDRPFRSCHASTLIVLPNEDIVAAWFGGTRESNPDVAIWCSRRTSGKWSEPVKVADEEDIPHWNPVLHLDDVGVVHLYYKVGKKIRSWRTFVITSNDGGVTWSERKQLVEGDESGGRGPVKNKLIVLRDGTWAAPASVEEEQWDAFVDLSHDHGITWTKSALVPLNRQNQSAEQRVLDSADETLPPVPAASLSGKGVIQPTLWESEPGNVHMLLRTTSGTIFRSDSSDGGKTWCEAYSTGLPNNNSGIDLTILQDGTLVLIYNPVAENWGARTPLVLSLSQDNGLTWEDEFVLENEPGEYSYPAIVSVGSHLYLTYTWKRERVAYWKLQVDKQARS